ncbi:MAG TPA: hypothetical protein VKQ52_11755, partial [Puia sp.]|nr:hypothetical protein [Puia sp.]
MSDSPSFQKDTTDDLDLAPMLVKAITFIRQHGWKIMLSSLVGLVMGGFLYYLLPHTYKARMVVQSSVLSNAQDLRVINNWDDLLNKNGYAILGAIWHQPYNVVSELNGIKAEIIPGTDENSGIVIEAAVSDSSMLPGVQQGIIYGLENSEYIKQRVATRRQNLEYQIAQTKQELAKLDSARSYLRSFSGGSEPANSRLVLDVSNVTSQRLSCYDRIAGFEEKLKFTRGVYLLQEFVPAKRGKIIPAPVLPLLGFALGLLLSYCSVV